MNGTGTCREQTIPVILATGNPDKVKELRPMLEHISPLFSIFSLSDLDVAANIEETEPTLSGNALLKADGIFAIIEQRFPFLVTIADDTGLEVLSLGSEPGVLSARFAPVQTAGMKPTYEDNIDHLLLRMNGLKERRARFRTVIALKGRIPSGETAYAFRLTAEGVVEGSIVEEKKGTMGFGYDPVFHVTSAEKTYAEMAAEEKNRISHRAIALQKVSDALSDIMSKHYTPQ